MLSDGVVYLDSWVKEGMGRCFQLMEGESADQLREWTARRDDLVTFEVIPMIRSAEG